MICPICQKAEAARAYQPFCSRRCADQDLSHWLSGTYSVPAGLTGDDDFHPVPDPGPEGEI